MYTITKTMRTSGCRFTVFSGLRRRMEAAPLPGGRKLGEERPRIRREQVEGEGSVMDQYRYRQLLDYQLDLAAKKTRLTSDEARVLFVLYQCGEFESMRRLSEVADLPLTRLFLALQKLERKKLVELSDEKEQSAVSGAELTPEGEENGIKGKRKKEKKEKKPRKPRAKKEKTEAAPKLELPPTEKPVCPICHKGSILRGKTAYGCSEYKNGCTFRLDYATYGNLLTDEELSAVINKLKP